MSEDDRVDSVDVILRVVSGNNIMINDSINQSEIFIYYYKEVLFLEDERALYFDVSVVVFEIQNKRMIGSGVEDDMFIEYEILFLVFGGYMFDTFFDVFIIWFVYLENYFEFIMEENFVVCSGFRIVKFLGR